MGNNYEVKTPNIKVPYFAYKQRIEKYKSPKNEKYQSPRIKFIGKHPVKPFFYKVKYEPRESEKLHLRISSKENSELNISENSPKNRILQNNVI